MEGGVMEGGGVEGGGEMGVLHYQQNFATTILKEKKKIFL